MFDRLKERLPWGKKEGSVTEQAQESQAQQPQQETSGNTTRVSVINSTRPTVTELGNELLTALALPKGPEALKSVLTRASLSGQELSIGDLAELVTVRGVQMMAEDVDPDLFDEAEYQITEDILRGLTENEKPMNFMGRRF